MIKSKMTVVENSSLISAYVWYSNGDLTIRFKDGSHYRYENVDQKTFDSFENSTSKGSFFATQIRGKFQSEKVESLGKLVEDEEFAPWPFPTGPRPGDIINENFDTILEWTPEEEEEL